MVETPAITSGGKSNASSGAQLRYSDDGRSGTIYYESPDACFDMWYELADGTALAIIGLPPLKFWEAHTKIALTNRDEVLQFVGDQLIQDKLHGNGHFQVDQHDFLTIYYGKK
ncbi:MAG: hypothetical protein EOO88_47970 [Pedobacter sp.]|nr:MAG: hypothetical protein EOO88_47970 [Pedobacter sp.]